MAIDPKASAKKLAKIAKAKPTEKIANKIRMRSAYVLACVGACVLSAAAPGAASGQPLAGRYVTTLGLFHVKGTACLDGENGIGAVFNYPGPSQLGATLQTAVFEGSGNSHLYVFSATPAVDARNWRGTFTMTVWPGGQKISGTFDFAFSHTDSTTFTGQLELVGGGCSLDYITTMIWAGPGSSGAVGQ
jgi:hypothetical protein